MKKLLIFFFGKRCARNRWLQGFYWFAVVFFFMMLACALLTGYMLLFVPVLLFPFMFQIVYAQFHPAVGKKKQRY